MAKLSLRQRLASNTECAPAKAELRRRILEIVNRKLRLTDMGIWCESAPNYLPWNPMLQELRAMGKDEKLRLEIVGPGHLIVHSLEAPPAKTKPAAKAVSKPKPSKPAKRSDSKAKQPKA